MPNAALIDLDEHARDGHVDSASARTQVALVRSLMDEIVRVELRDGTRVAALAAQLDEEKVRLDGMRRGRPSEAPASGVHATTSGDRVAREGPR